ncbi:hypothetical protein BGX33_000312 [Mortierella sp. NVP41]|nr:hypothetical protein BGX33_000312 [Mortierella sp. NVP41]
MSIKTHGSRGVEQLGLLFKHCSALMTFDSPYESKKDLQDQWTDVAREIAANCREFQELTGSGQGTVAILEHIRMDALRRLVSGSFGDSEIARTFELIAIRQSNSLTEIRLVHVHHVRGTALQAILWTCARLEHLVIRGYESVATRLKHLVEKGWVCLRLKPLEITVDLRRRKLLAYIMQTWGQPMPCVNEAMSIMLQKFYRQIGALTEIQVLNLKAAVDDNDEWSVDEDEHRWRRYDHLREQDEDASFPGLLPLGDPLMRRPGYLDCLSGLTKLRELRGAMQATTSETSRTFGSKELEWMLAHWTKLEVIGLLPAFTYRDGRKRNLLPMDLSPPHIVCFQQQRPDINIQQALL